MKNTKFKVIGGRDYIQADAEVYFLDNGVRKSAIDKFDIGIKNLRIGEIRKAHIKNVKGNIYYTDININNIAEEGYTLIGINRENKKEINLHIRYDKPFLFLANNKVYDIKDSNFKIKRLKPYTLKITDYLVSPKNYTQEGGRPITEITIHHMAMVASAEKCGRVFQNLNHQA